MSGKKRKKGVEDRRSWLVRWSHNSVPWLSAFTIVVISWGLGGGTQWGSWFVFAMGWGCWIASLIVNLEMGKAGWRRLVPSGAIPWLFLVVMAVVSIWNPSFERITESGGESFFQSVAHNESLPSTVNVPRTIRYLCLLTGLMAYGIALYSWPWRRSAIRRLLQLIYVNGLVLAVAGTLVVLIGSDKFLGFIDSYDGGQKFSTFHYKNNWIGFLVLCLAVGVALFAKELKKGLLSKRSAAAFYLTTLPILVVTIPLSKSRAGIVLVALLGAWILGRFVYSAIAGRKKMRLAAVIPCAIILCLATGFSLKIGAQELEANWRRSKIQYESHVSAERLYGRFVLMRDTVKMAKAKPLFGWGIGSFKQVFPIYQGSELYDKKRIEGLNVWTPHLYEFSHNDYLQYWAEIGFAGSAMLTVVPLLFVVVVWHEGRNKVRSNSVGHWLAVGCGLVMLLALIDYPFGNEAICVLFVTLFVLSGKSVTIASSLRQRDTSSRA